MVDSHAHLTRRFNDVLAKVSKVLIEVDPAGLIGLGAPRDEYDDEAFAIAQRVLTAHESPHYESVVRAVFEGSFGDSVSVDYQRLAAELASALGPLS